MNKTLLTLKGLGKDFLVKSRKPFAPKDVLIAVDHIDLELKEGETLGLVGESGCGKSTLGRLICCLDKPDRGQIVLRGEAIEEKQGEALRTIRHQFQPIFQDPYGSLNPRMSVKETLEEALQVRGNDCDQDAIALLLKRSGLGLEVRTRYPHQLSGGQRQRIGIARALALDPDLIVADEPVSSLDVSIQAQILNLFLDIQQQMKLSMIFISHDLRVVGHVADRVAVMYVGRIMEIAPVKALFDSPGHPYTQALLEALPRLEPGRGRKRAVLKGDLPTPINPESGCRFYSRCQYGQPKCLDYENELLNYGAGHKVACCKWQEISN